jgi:hypothetical protein
MLPNLVTASMYEKFVRKPESITARMGRAMCCTQKASCPDALSLFAKALRISMRTLVPVVTAGAIVMPGIGDSLTFDRKQRRTICAVALESVLISKMGFTPGDLFRWTALRI